MKEATKDFIKGCYCAFVAMILLFAASIVSRSSGAEVPLTIIGWIFGFAALMCVTFSVWEKLDEIQNREAR